MIVAPVVDPGVGDVRIPKCVAAVGVLLIAPATGLSVATVSMNATSVSVTEPQASVGITMSVSVVAGSAGPSDDAILIDYLGPYNAPPVGCTVTPLGLGNRLSCPLAGPGINRTLVNISLTGSVSDSTVTVGADRPDGALTVSVTGSGTDSAYTFNASTTTHANVVLTGNNAPNTFIGGAGNDALVGNAGNDVLRGGPGNDTLTPGLGTAQIVDGGPGSRDVISFTGETVPVAVSLDGVENDGPQGRTVSVTAVEDIVGGQVDDVLVGDAGSNIIDGYEGNDTISGGGGVFDITRGGLGSDAIDARGNPAGYSDVDCGPGIDTATVDSFDLTDPSCETVAREPGASTPAPAVTPQPTPTLTPTQSDTTPPTVAITGVTATVRRSRLLTGLPVRVTTNERAALVVELIGTTGTGVADNLVLARRRLPVGAGVRSARLRTTTSLLRSARRLGVRIIATDAAGNVRTTILRVRVLR